VSKPKQINADSHGSRAGANAWRSDGRVDNRLASLYQGTLEEAIPDELMRLVARIDEQCGNSGKS
jgi:hypothetical protein